MIEMRMALGNSKVDSRRAEAILSALQVIDPYSVLCIIGTPTACPLPSSLSSES